MMSSFEIASTPAITAGVSSRPGGVRGGGGGKRTRMRRKLSPTGKNRGQASESVLSTDKIDQSSSDEARQVERKTGKQVDRFADNPTS